MKDQNETFEISGKGKLDLPFLAIKEAILGKRYSLSLVFATANQSRKLNKTWRDKDYPTNVLSFPNTKESGEVLLHLPTAKKEAKKFGMPYRDFVGYLFIHGLLHLKGFDHGTIMEHKEKTFLKRFGLATPLD